MEEFMKVSILWTKNMAKALVCGPMAKSIQEDDPMAKNMELELWWMKKGKGKASGVKAKELSGLRMNNR